jgi:hypothetical protein
MVVDGETDALSASGIASVCVDDVISGGSLTACSGRGVIFLGGEDCEERRCVYGLH